MQEVKVTHSRVGKSNYLWPLDVMQSSPRMVILWWRGPMKDLHPVVGFKGCLYSDPLHYMAGKGGTLETALWKS